MVVSPSSSKVPSSYLLVEAAVTVITGLRFYTMVFGTGRVQPSQCDLLFFEFNAQKS